MVHRKWLPPKHRHVPKDPIDQWSLELAWKKSRSLAPKPLEMICPWTSLSSSGKGRCLFGRIHSSTNVSTMHGLQLLQQFGLQQALYSPCRGNPGTRVLHARPVCAKPMSYHHPWARRLHPRRLLHSRAGHSKWQCPAKSLKQTRRSHRPQGIQFQQSKIASPILHPQLLGFCIETIFPQAHSPPRKTPRTDCPGSLVSKGHGTLGEDGGFPANPPTPTPETNPKEKERLQSDAFPRNPESWHRPTMQSSQPSNNHHRCLNPFSIAAGAAAGISWPSWWQLSGCPSRWQCPTIVPLPLGTRWREAPCHSCKGPAWHGWVEWLLPLALLEWHRKGGVANQQREGPHPNLPSKCLDPLERPNSRSDMCPNLGSYKDKHVARENPCRRVQARDGLPRRSLPHRALPVPKRCRWDRTAGKGQTSAPCPIEMAATDSNPPGLELEEFGVQIGNGSENIVALILICWDDLFTYFVAPVVYWLLNLPSLLVESVWNVLLCENCYYSIIHKIEKCKFKNKK